MGGLLRLLTVAGDAPGFLGGVGALRNVLLFGGARAYDHVFDDASHVRVTSFRIRPAVGDNITMNGVHMIVTSVIERENAFMLRPAFVPRNRIIFDELIAPALTPPEPKDWSAKRRFKAAKKSSKPPALFASMLKRI